MSIGVACCVRERLCESGVGAIVASTPPPTGEFARTERVGHVWIAWLEARPWADSGAPGVRIAFAKNHGKAEIAIDSPRAPRSSCARPGTPAGTRASTENR